MASFVRISVLLWADILVAFALFVMQNYLTDVWKISFTRAAAIVNICGGIAKVLPVFFLFLVDEFLGKFKMLRISSTAYSVGIGFVTISTPPVYAIFTSMCKKYEPDCIGHTQKFLLYTGMALIAVGQAGNSVSLTPLIEERQNQHNGSATIRCSKIFGMILVVVVALAGAIALPYVKPWKLRFGIPAICTAIATLLFVSSGWRNNPGAELRESPIRTVCRVFVAAVWKRSQPFPEDDRQIYTENEESFSQTCCLGYLHKAAIILPESEVSRQNQVNNKWGLCSVKEVETAKIAIRMVPMWITFVICGIVSSIGNSYFVEQGKKMDRKIGKWRVPLQVLLLAKKCAKNCFAKRADCLLRKIPCNSAPSFGIAVAMIFSILCCIAAAIVETFRLKVIRNHGLLDKPEEKIPMSVLWLLIQFTLLAGLDSFFEKGVAKFYQDQSPECMRNYLDHFARGVSGLGFMCSVLSVYVVGKISEIGGKTNWFQHTLNKSHLERYYWVLAGLSSVNLLVFFIPIASRYRYRNRHGTGGGAAAAEEAPVEVEERCFSCCYWCG